MKVAFSEEIDRVRTLVHRTKSTSEEEKMEVLESAVESLRGGSREQVRAAIRLLEHLAHPR